MSRLASAVLAWELCNEPRAVAPPPSRRKAREALIRWARSAASMIKKLAPRQLVVVGSEGLTPFEEYANDAFLELHREPAIDAVTIHVWPENWGWDDGRSGGRMHEAIARSVAYVREHADLAREIGKPLIIEEFGLARDGGSFGDAPGRTLRRDAFFAEIFRVARGEGVSGVIPWTWGGEARPSPPGGGYWHPGEPYLGDPPHERQGWYSIFATDESTLGMLVQGFDAAGVPPEPPALPLPPSPPPTPASPPICASELADDTTDERCEAWCSEADHCQLCAMSDRSWRRHACRGDTSGD